MLSLGVFSPGTPRLHIPYINSLGHGGKTTQSNTLSPCPGRTHLPLFLASLGNLSSKQISNANLQQPTERRVLKKVLARHCCAESFNSYFQTRWKLFIFSNLFILRSLPSGASFSLASLKVISCRSLGRYSVCRRLSALSRVPIAHRFKRSRPPEGECVVGVFLLSCPWHCYYKSHSDTVSALKPWNSAVFSNFLKLTAPLRHTCWSQPLWIQPELSVTFPLRLPWKP